MSSVVSVAVSVSEGQRAINARDGWPSGKYLATPAAVSPLTSLATYSNCILNSSRVSFITYADEFALL